MSGIIPWWGFDQDMNVHPVSPRQLPRSKFLIGACHHACTCFPRVCVLQPCSAAGTLLFGGYKKLVFLCVFPFKKKVRIEEEGIWGIPEAEVLPSALKIAALCRGDGS